MRKFIYIILVSFCIMAFQSHQGSCLVFEKKVVDFGLLKAPWEKTGIFRFTNNSKDSILIKNSKAGCGCTTVKYPEYYIKAGKTDSVIVKFLPQKWLNGSQEKEVKLKTTCPTDSIIVLTIMAEVAIY